MPADLLTAISKARILQWKSQHTISLSGNRGFVDLCLLADNNLVLIIENKINAGFTTHRVIETEEEPSEDGDDNCNQLEFYEQYLNTKGRTSGLILLTHSTEPPSTFTDSGVNPRQSGNIFRRVCRWAEIHKWLASSNLLGILARHSDAAALSTLAQELRQFLEERQLIPTEWSSDDLSTLKMFFSQDFPLKLQGMFQSTRNAVRIMPELSAHQVWPRRAMSFELKEGIVWDWLYCIAPELQWFISWGIAGKLPLSRNYGIEFESPLQAIVLVGSDRQDIPYSHEEIHAWKNRGWTVYEALGSQRLRLVKAISPEELFVSSNDFNDSFRRWVTQAVKESVAMLTTAHKMLLNQKQSNATT
jgi:hypothetical protein